MNIPLKAALPLLGLLCIPAGEARSQTQVVSGVIAAAPVSAENHRYHISATLGQPAVGLATLAGAIVEQGFWHASPRPAVAGATEPGSAEEPTLSVFPVPFAESAQLTLHLPGRQHLSLVLYDMLGKPVRVLIDSEQPEGTLNLTLAADELPSGRYTLSATAGNRRQTMPIIIVR